MSTMSLKAAAIGEKPAKPTAVHDFPTIYKSEIANPFVASALTPVRPGTTAAAHSDQQRAIAEVQAAMLIARMNPRDPIVAMDRILNACTRPTLADASVYTYSKGGSDVSGPSIRLAEAIAQAWGNIQFGIRELDQAQGESTVQAYAWDVETNTRREITFQVPHLRHTRKGSYKLEDPRDIYELVANQGARRLRACILAVIPGDVTEAAVAQCETTMQTKADTSGEALQKMLAAFEPFGITREQIEKRIQRRLDTLQPAQIVSLKKIYASLRDGMSSPADWFETPETEPQAAPPSASRTHAASAKARPQRAVQRSAEPDPQNEMLPPVEQDSQPKLDITAAQLAEQLSQAKDIDLLDAAADLIGEVDDPTQREELSALYKKRREELSQ